MGLAAEVSDETIHLKPALELGPHVSGLCWSYVIGLSGPRDMEIGRISAHCIWKYWELYGFFSSLESSSARGELQVYTGRNPNSYKSTFEVSVWFQFRFLFIAASIDFVEFRYLFNCSSIFCNFRIWIP